MSSAKHYHHTISTSTTSPKNTSKPPTSTRKQAIHRSNLCPFLVKLWSMVNDEDEPAIQWAPAVDGNVFTIVDESRFCGVTLPQYFRSSRLASFKRQLNYFRFRSLGRGRAMSFTHPNFRPSDPAALKGIRRRTKIATATGAHLDGSQQLQLHGAPNHWQPQESLASSMVLPATCTFPNDPGLTPITPMATVSFAVLCSYTTCKLKLTGKRKCSDSDSDSTCDRKLDRDRNSYCCNSSNCCDFTFWSWPEN